MTKQLLPLEALGLLKGYILDSSSIYFDTLVKRFEIVETALKDYEYLKLVAKPLTDEEKKSINSVARRLKVLEIIKEKITAVSFKYGGIMGNVIQIRIGCDTCYLHFDENDKNFDLLKEELSK